MEDEKRIRERAHQIWEHEGRPEGRHEEHWSQARRQIETEDGAATASEAPTPTAPDHGGTAPAEAAAAVANVERRHGSEGVTAPTEPAASSGSPTPAAPDGGGTTPGEAAAAAANPTGRRSGGRSRRR